MNTKEAVTAAKGEYQKALRKIALANKIAGKIEPLLPTGWEAKVDDVCFNLEIRKEDPEKTDATEFKFICRLVEKATGEKLDRKARVSQEDNEIWGLAGDVYFSSNGCCLWINVFLFNPKYLSDCKIEWVETTVKKARVSDECLGLNGGAA